MNTEQVVGLGALLSSLIGVGWTLRASIERLNSTIGKLLAIMVERELNGGKK